MSSFYGGSSIDKTESGKWNKTKQKKCLKNNYYNK